MKKYLFIVFRWWFWSCEDEKIDESENINIINGLWIADSLYTVDGAIGEHYGLIKMQYRDASCTT